MVLQSPVTFDKGTSLGHKSIDRHEQGMPGHVYSVLIKHHPAVFQGLTDTYPNRGSGHILCAIHASPNTSAMGGFFR